MGMGMFQVGSGALAIATGTAVGAGPLVWAGAKIGLFGAANISRGTIQAAEGIRGDDGMTGKNLLGLLPWGHNYDDPTEPSIGEYWGDTIAEFGADPVGMLLGKIRDFFVPGEAPSPGEEGAPEWGESWERGRTPQGGGGGGR